MEQNKITQGFRQILKERIEAAKAEGKLQPVKLSADKVRTPISARLAEIIEKAKAEGKIKPMAKVDKKSRMADIMNKLKDRRKNNE